MVFLESNHVIKLSSESTKEFLGILWCSFIHGYPMPYASRTYFSPYSCAPQAALVQRSPTQVVPASFFFVCERCELVKAQHLLSVHMQR